MCTASNGRAGTLWLFRDHSSLADIDGVKKSHSVLRKQQNDQNDGSEIAPVCQRIGESHQGAQLILVKKVMLGEREDRCVQGFVNDVQKQLNKNCDRDRE